MARILEDIWQFIVNCYERVLDLLDFDLAGKNLRYELLDLLEPLFYIGLIFLAFKVMFSKSESIKGKFILVSLFVLIYLVANIWIF